MKNDDSEKRINKAEYRTKLLEAELNAVRASRAYRLSKKIGIVKNQIKSDPIGLSKKLARILVNDPKKARHILRSINRGASITQSISEQNAKYQEWILLNEPDENELNEQRVLADSLSYKPLISIVTPVFNPPIDVFEELIESVLDQTYANFELCLGNFGDDPEVERMISRYAKEDPRIKQYTFTENKGIAGNSNLILNKVKGEYIALLDHDDTLSADALYENAKLLNEKPYDFIYSDKDKIDEKGNRFDALFKAQLSPEMLLNVNYLTHLNVMRTDLVREIGGWDPATDGAQDWDLFLRIISVAKLVGFIPKVLYHWRVIATSTAMSIETKPYALANQCKAIDKFLKKNNIPGKAYIERTELFIKWNEKYLDEKPLVFIYFSNFPSTRRVIRKVKNSVKSPRFVILLESGDTRDHIKNGIDELKVECLTYSQATLFDTIAGYLESNKSSKFKTALFLLDGINFSRREEWYENLTGWLNVKDVSASSGRLLDRNELIVSSGGLITKNQQYFPLFQGYPRYYQGYIGNAEWIRNLSVITPIFCALSIENLVEYIHSKHKTKSSFDDYFLWLTSQGNRIVMTPHAVASIHNTDIDPPRALDINKSRDDVKSQPFVDPYSNHNMSPADPLKLFENERSIGIEKDTLNHEPMNQYQHDAAILADTFDITSEEISHNHNLLVNAETINPTSVAWFLPGFDGVYAGLMNIFNYANYLAKTKGLRTTIYLLKAGNDASLERNLVTASFPGLKSASFIAISPQDTTRIKAHDIGIATQWATTFPLAKTNKIHRKCYFIQDNEVNFYPKGSISALVELSYKFGFFGIAGTEGLLDMYRKQYGGEGVVVNSKVDLSEYRPRKNMHYIPKKPYKVFFYARPNMPRNAFELGIAGLKKLKKDFGDDVEIITAGAEWDTQAYGVHGMFTNLGKISFEAVPKLYRSVDAGLMFMFSGHPGVTASELMASGCPVVVNEYEDVTWQKLYVHEKTCLTTMPVASEVARNLTRCLTDTALREVLIEGGLAKANDFYVNYEDSLNSSFNAICSDR